MYLNISWTFTFAKKNEKSQVSTLCMRQSQVSLLRMRQFQVSSLRMRQSQVSTLRMSIPSLFTAHASIPSFYTAHASIQSFFTAHASIPSFYTDQWSYVNSNCLQYSVHASIVFKLSMRQSKLSPDTADWRMRSRQAVSGDRSVYVSEHPG